MSRSKRSIAGNVRGDEDEIYIFPKYTTNLLDTKNSAVIVQYQDDSTALIIAANIPGSFAYHEEYDRYPGAHEFSNNLVDDVLDFLSEYDATPSSSRSNQGNYSLRDIYVRVPQEDKNEVILEMWKVLNYMKERHSEFLKEEFPDRYDEKYGMNTSLLEDEVLEITKDMKAKYD